MSPSSPTRQPATPKPVERHTAPGGVMYVGPSLTRSLFDFAVALSRAST